MFFFASDKIIPNNPKPNTPALDFTLPLPIEAIRYVMMVERARILCLLIFKFKDNLIIIKNNE